MLENGGLIKSSWAITCVKWLKGTSVLGTISVPIIRDVMGTEMAPETSFLWTIWHGWWPERISLNLAAMKTSSHTVEEALMNNDVSTV